MGEAVIAEAAPEAVDAPVVVVGAAAAVVGVEIVDHVAAADGNNLVIREQEGQKCPSCFFARRMGCHSYFL